jgi:hypothetical protein
MKMSKIDYINAKISNSMFRSYDSNILYRTTTNYHTISYYRVNRKAFSQKQYEIAKNIVISDLHTIIDKICDFTN